MRTDRTDYRQGRKGKEGNPIDDGNPIKIVDQVARSVPCFVSFAPFAV